MSQSFATASSGPQGNQGFQGPQGAPGSGTVLVAGYYTSTSAQSVPSTPAAIGFENTSYQTHSIASGTGSLWKATIPIAGQYHVEVFLADGTTATGVQYFGLSILQNGVVKASDVRWGSSGVVNLSAGTAVILNCAAGDQITVTASGNIGGGTSSTNTTAAQNFFSIMSIGAAGATGSQGPQGIQGPQGSLDIRDNWLFR